MSNDEVYAGGLLTKALDPASQPETIRAFLREEITLIQESVASGTRVIDFGCGYGRHLALLANRLSLGVGVEYQRVYVADAIRRHGGGRLHFVVADGTSVPVERTFDMATCLTNTWGTMTDKAGILREMRRLSPRSRSRVLSVYAESSVPARCEWYARLDQEVTAVTAECIETAGGFRSEHFSEARLRALVGECVVRPFAGIGYFVLA